MALNCYLTYEDNKRIRTKLLVSAYPSLLLVRRNVLPAYGAIWLAAAKGNDGIDRY